MHFNFELILFYATVVTGIVALIDVVFFAKKRMRSRKHMPMLIDYCRSFFPVLLLVFILRSFLFEPFRIPSGSLEPTLLVGDFILVNKFDYGVRLPVLHNKIVTIHEPVRGDIIVFRWPPNTSYDFIKRVIGVPGDKISYVNKELLINGVKIPQELLGKRPASDDSDGNKTVEERREDLLGVKHHIYVNPARDSSDYNNLTVPKGMYFVLGDNRDDSADSRYWGFVSEKNIVGKAVAIWMSWDADKSRVRWNRLGTLINSKSKS